MSETTARYLDDYQRLHNVLPGQELPWLLALRRDALQRFTERGYPTPRDEAWKYTNVTSVVRQAFTPTSSSGRKDEVTRADLSAHMFGVAGMPLAVFINGRFSAALSDLKGLPRGVEVRSVREVLDHEGDLLEALLSTQPLQEPHGFIELNTVFMADGAYIRLAPETVLEQPIHLLYVSSGTEQPTGAYLRNLMVAGRGSRAAVIEHYVSLKDARCLTNVATRCVLERDAALEHYKLNEEGDGIYHFAGIHVEQGANSHYTSHNIGAGGRMIRNDLFNVLGGEGGECLLNGLYLGRGRQHIDNHTLVDHRVPHCTSREWYKGVLDGESRGVFGGHVVVHQDAQKTDAQQMNHNLLLSDDAEVDTRPQLEIYADDVKCSHGSTVGQLNPEVLFYLRARGIGEQLARRLLVAAFAQDVVARMTVAPVRAWAERLLATRLMH